MTLDIGMMNDAISVVFILHLNDNIILWKLYIFIFSRSAGPSLPLSALRLLVPPIRLVSAAIWQTVEQKIVSDYGLLEEFVFMVTEIVPQILSTRQRAELILGLRARVRKSSCGLFLAIRRWAGKLESILCVCWLLRETVREQLAEGYKI